MSQFISLLKQENIDTLKEKGFRPAKELEFIFAKERIPAGLLLYPENFFILIPDGTEIVFFSGRVDHFDYESTSPDVRGGLLAFGFIHKDA